MNRRKFGHLVAGGLLGGLSAPFVLRADGPKTIRLAMPQFNGDVKLIKKFVDNYKVKYEFVSYSNNHNMMESVINSEAPGDIIIATTSTLQRLHARGLLKKINFNNIYRYSPPDYSLVGKYVNSEQDYILPLGTYQDIIGCQKGKKTAEALDWSDILLSSKNKGKTGLGIGDFNESVRLASLCAGYGYIPQEDNIKKISDFIMKNKKNWYLAEDNSSSILDKKVDYAVLGTVEVINMMNDKPGEIDYYYPKFGGIMNEIAMAIPLVSNERILAEEVINFFYQPQVYAVILQISNLTNHNKKYRNFLPTEYTNNKLIQFKHTSDQFQNIYAGEATYQAAFDIYKKTLLT